MGSGTFNPASYASYTRSTAHKTRDEVFTSRRLDQSLDPKGVKIRESRDSADSPEATPIIVAVDVTGSMGMLAEAIARKGLGTTSSSPGQRGMMYRMNGSQTQLTLK